MALGAGTVIKIAKNKKCKKGTCLGIPKWYQTIPKRSSVYSTAVWYQIHRMPQPTKMIPKHTKTYQTYTKTILVYQPTALVSFLLLAAPYQNDVKPGHDIRRLKWYQRPRAAWYHFDRRRRVARFDIILILSAIHTQVTKKLIGAVSRYRKSASGELLVTTHTRQTNSWQPANKLPRFFGRKV